jgi:hypothetical protein
MDRKYSPLGSGDFGFELFSTTGSWPEIDLSATPSMPGSESDAGPFNWESEWIDLGGEG